MAHGIVKGVDAGAVGFVKELGHTWHGLTEYEELEGPLSVGKVREKLEYEVVKCPDALFVPEYLRPRMPAESHLKICKGMYNLVRVDKGELVFNTTVREDYQIYQNKDFIDQIENGILASYPSLAIESCGSLFGGNKAFVSILLDRFKVGKDKSETILRIMYTNAFGGGSISCSCHTRRVVCNNQHRLAEAQSAADETLRKFRHTKGAPEKVGKYLVDLCKLKAVTEVHKEALNHLADVQMDERDVKMFLGNLFPVPAVSAGSTGSADEEKSGRAIARRENKQGEILDLFEGLEDLQGDIKGTRYAMFQAVTYYNSHSTTKSIDSAFVFDNIVNGGNRHELNKKAFDILIGKDIPEVKTRDLVLV